MSRERRFYSAAVCRNGHPDTSIIELTNESEIADYCPDCGAVVLRSCPACDAPIRAMTAGMAGSNRYVPPDFCTSCAAPFPWISRAGTIHRLQAILDSADLPDADRLRAKEQLEALKNPDLDDEEQARRWGRFVKAAPSVWNSDATQRIVGTILEASVKAMVERGMR